MIICDRLQENWAQRGPHQKIFFLHLRICRHPDIEPSKVYCCTFSCFRYIRPNRSYIFKEFNRSFPNVYARHVVPDFPVDGHIFPYVLNFHS